MKKHTMRIFIRTHEDSKKIQSRAFNFNSTGEVILESVNSLLKSCFCERDRIVINIVDDSSSKEFRNKLRKLLYDSGINGEVLIINKGNSGANYEFCLDKINESPEDLFFLVEDDYLFLKHSIPYILDAYDNKIIGTGEFAIHPTDYPDRYDKLYASYIFADKNCHWRSISHTTGTFVITRKIYKKYKKYLYLQSTKLENESLNKIWKEIPLISPIPSLSAHLNYDTLPPFIDWQKELSRHIERNINPKDSSIGEIVSKKIKRYIYKNKQYIRRVDDYNLEAYNYLKKKNSKISSFWSMLTFAIFKIKNSK